MNLISDRLRAKIEAQTTRDEVAMIVAWLQEFDCKPETNELMRERVNDPNYADRGMWGPLGGEGGTVSQVWLEEQKYLNAGGPSELGLMTIIAPPENDAAQEN